MLILRLDNIGYKAIWDFFNLDIWSNLMHLLKLQCYLIVRAMVFSFASWVCREIDSLDKQFC